ncbi:MAG: amidohydrolase family protein [Pirellulales bacterium]
MLRRNFLGGALAASLAFNASRGSHAVGQTAAAAAPDTLEIIDCHTHFYDPSRPEGVPWPGKGTPLYRTVLPKHLREVKQYRPVAGTVVVEASPWVADNDWLLGLAKDDPFIRGVVGNLKPGDPDFTKNAVRLAKNPVFRGIRVSVQAVLEHIDKNQLDDFRKLAELNLALDVNGGPNTPAAIARLAPQIPDLRIVLNHIGNVRITRDPPPADWKTGIEAAAAHPNVFCKISALVEGAARDGNKAPKDTAFYRPYIDVVWNAFGDERVIYGSNWPVSDNAADYETLQRIALEYAMSRGVEATRRFCSTNSQTAYRWRQS